MTNLFGFSSLVVDASLDTAARASTLSSGSLVGMAPTTIQFVSGDLLSLRILGGRGSDSWVVDSTPNVPTTLVTGGGADRADVEGAPGKTLVVQGGAGNDAISAHASAPTGVSIAFVGGPGDDRFVVGNGVRLRGRIQGGPGTDTVSYASATHAVAVDLAAGSGTGTTAIRTVEDVTGGKGPTRSPVRVRANVLTGRPRQRRPDRPGGRGPAAGRSGERHAGRE